MDERRRQQERSQGANLQRRRTDQGLPKPVSLPWGWIAVDGIGALLFALGAAEYFGGWPVLSQVTTVPDVATIAMVAGTALMAVAMVGIVGALLQRRSTSGP